MIIMFILYLIEWVGKIKYIIKDFMVVGSFPPVFDLGPIDSYDLLFYTGALFSSIPLLLYNGEKGFSREPYTKYLFYVYYPLHIFIYEHFP